MMFVSVYLILHVQGNALWLYILVESNDQYEKNMISLPQILLTLILVAQFINNGNKSISCLFKRKDFLTHQ